MKMNSCGSKFVHHQHPCQRHMTHVDGVRFQQCVLQKQALEKMYQVNNL